MAERPVGWMSTDHQSTVAGPRFMAGMASLLVFGFVLVVLGAFLHQIELTTQGGDGLAKTASWFGWVGRAAVGGALVIAAMRGRDVSDGVRVGLLAIGTVVLFGLVTGIGPLLDAMLGR